jgi:hypothetical protein
MADFRPAPRVKNALDNRKLQLLTPCPTAAGKTSALQVGVFAQEKFGEPFVRVTVFTRDPEDQGERNDYGKIQAEFEPPAFYAFLEALDRIAKGPAGTEDKIKWEVKGITFFGGKRSDTPQVKAEVHFGKDADGTVWIGVMKPNRPKIKFSFGITDFHNLVHKTGEQVSRAECSEYFALGWTKMLRDLLPAFIISLYKDVPWDPQGNKGGGQGGGQRQWNNNGGGGQGGNGGGQPRQQAAAVETSDDDIPW